MRVHEIHCPECDTTLRSKAGIPVGQSVSCPKCKNKFAVEEPDRAGVDDEDDVEERAPAKRKGPPARRTGARDDEDEDERPRKKKASARKGRDHDDEDEDRPRKKKIPRPRDEDEPESLYRRL